MLQTNGSKPQIRSVSSVAFAVTGDAPLDRAVELAVAWIRSLNADVPSDAGYGSDFDIGGGGAHPAKSVSLDYGEGRIWSATVDNPDNSVLGRTWITEITIAERGEEVHVGIRLLNINRQSDERFTPSIPRVARDIISTLPCMADGRRLSAEPTYVESELDVDVLVELLTNPKRRLPIILMAQATSRLPVVRLEKLAKRLCPAAHVMGITDTQTWNFTKQVGREFTVYDGAVRIYRQGLSLESADAFSHLLWLPSQKASSPSSGAPIISRVLSSGVSKGTTDYPRFEAVRQAVVEKRIGDLRASSSEAEMLQLYEAENLMLMKQFENLRNEQNQWLSDSEAERALAEARGSELKADVHRFRVQNENLRLALKTSGSSSKREALSELSSFGDWVEKNLTPNIWLAPKAIKCIERFGIYRNPQEIGEAMVLLDDVYVPMRRSSSAELFQEWQDKLGRLGFIVSDCFVRRGDMERFDEYSVMYHGEKRWCDQHLKSGGGTDPKNMFRIYFNWHEDDGKLIIGHLPTHLDNNMTN